MSKTWTENQSKAISADKGEVLVSASAGSGKTSVMIERLVRLIKSGVDVENVLCLTFTKAAASEMRERLFSSLLKSIRTTEDMAEQERLVEQLDKIPFSSITTIDAFCLKIVKKYFEKTNLPVDANLASTGDSEALKYSSAVSVLEEFGERDDQIYYNLIDFLGKKRRTDSVLEVMLKVYDFVYTLPDPDRYLSDVEEHYYLPVRENPITKYVVSRIKNDLRELEVLSKKCMNYDVPYPEECWSKVYHLSEKLALGLDEFSCEMKKEFPEKPSFAKKEYRNLSDEGKADIDLLRKKMQSFIESHGDFDMARIEKDERDLAPYVSKLVEVVRAFCKEYEDRKRRENLTDFAEIEQTALRALKNPEVQKEVREKYTHVLIDEYQDTNRLQESILALSGGNESFFTVGDAKQSIYAFRHTEPEIFIERQKTVGENAIVLSENFRQDEKLIDVVNDVFSAVMKPEWAGVNYEDEKMKPGLTRESREEKPFTLCFVRGEKDESVESAEKVYSVKERAVKEKGEKGCAEGEYLYKKITELVGKRKILDGDKTRYLKYEDIVVLYRSYTERVHESVEYLKRRGIPVGEKLEKGLPTSGELLIHLLRVLDNPHTDESLAVVMLSPLFEFLEDELLNLRIEGGREKGKSLYSSLQSIQEKSEKLQFFFDKIQEYTTRAQYVDVYTLLEYVIKDLSFDTKIGARKGGDQEYKLLSAYMDALQTSSVAGSVSSYLSHFDAYPVFSTKQETGSYDSVRFMTIHGAKGLEFPVVFLIDADKNFNNEDVYKAVIFHKTLGVGLETFSIDDRRSRKNFFESTIKEKTVSEGALQELRLLYVAMTRAKNLLFVSGKWVKSSENKIEPKEAGSLLDFIRIAMNKDSALSSKIQVENYTIGELDDEREVIEHETDESVDEYDLVFVYPYLVSTKTPTKYTVTGLTRDEYEGEEGIAVPVKSAESAEVGTLYHKVMQRIDFGAQSDEEIKAELDKMVLDEFITYDERESVDQEIIKKVLSLPIIKDVGDGEVMREKSFLLRVPCDEIRESECTDEVLLQGVIDLLIVKDGEAVVVDYKYSGASESVLIERYKKQLSLYKKAVEEILGIKKVRVYLLSLKNAKYVELV